MSATAEFSPQRPPLIVAIGASAGGLTAFKMFFSKMPADSGMAFVLVQHLDPNLKSLLVEIIARHTAMPVAEAENGVRVAANTVTIIPPNATLTIKSGILRVERPAPPRSDRWPINSFFSSLAEDQGENAVCIVLSGTGSDGTMGVSAIKEHGGLAMAQSEYDHVAMSGMPESAAATGLVDFVLHAEEMPAKLLQYYRHLNDVASRKSADGLRLDAPDHLVTITGLLRARLGHDFSRYKTNTIIRRIQRRMQVLEIDTMSAFIERLRRDPAQLDSLFADMLIGVTQFFRDPEAFTALQVIGLPLILKDKGNGDSIRIWVPGCSTGEEVYSIAILLREMLDRAGITAKVQIFGTDIDETAVATARAGRYSKTMLGLSPERIARWFADDTDSCCVVKEIREICVFSIHSLVKDPPFSKLDLISCRNILIYLNGEVQEVVIRAFHYALRPDGILFLGPSEGVTRNGGQFNSLDAKHRIYQRHETSMPVRLPSYPRCLASAAAARSIPERSIGRRSAREKHPPRAGKTFSGLCFNQRAFRDFAIFRR